MQAKQDEVGLALADIAAIRSAINTTRRTQEGVWDQQAYRASLNAQLVSLSLCTFLLFIELVTGGYLTLMLEGSQGEPFFKTLGTIIVASFLILGTANFYFIVWRAAQQSEQSLSDFLRGNFKYLQNISHLADLFVKFCIYTAFIWADRSDWIPPLLLLFTADYLIQGRLFTFSIRLSLGLGILYAALSGAQLWSGSDSIFWPLLAFVVLQASSVYFLRSKMRIVGGDES